MLHLLLQATVGSYKQYQLSFWGQLILGSLYSFGYFDHWLIGLALGFGMPVLWIVLTYRFVLHKARENVYLPFPAWMQKNPGNSVVVFIDTVFLGFIWWMILSGLYQPTWLKLLFTVVFPILSLSMLRNLMIFPFKEKEDTDTDSQKV
ncbi:MAG: hypothetical protein ACK4VN_14745 [Bacteroidales bacterium]